MTKQQAVEVFIKLIKKHGVAWTSGRVPIKAHEELMECSKFLTERERNGLMLKVSGVGSGR